MAGLMYPNATDCELEFLAERLGLTAAAVVSRAVGKFYESMENDMQNAIMVNESNGQYQIAPNAEPEDWKEVSDYGKVVRVESLTGWGEWTSAYTIEQPPWVNPVGSRTQWYFVAE